MHLIYQSPVSLKQDVLMKKDPKVKGILKNYKFVGAVHCLNDVLSVLKCLSLKLQENEAYFANITNLIEMTVGRLGALVLNGGGECFQGFLCNIEEKKGQTFFKGIYLTHSHTMTPFDAPWETSLLKTLWEKEKLLVTSNFSFSHSVFYPFG